MSSPDARADARRWRACAGALGVLAVVLLGLLAVLCARPDLPGTLATRVGLRPSVSPFDAYIRDTRASHRRMDAAIPDHAVLFLGDSHVQGLAVTAVSPRGVNLGIGGQTSEELGAALPPALRRADALVIAVGANDFAQRKEAGLAQRLEALDAALPAGLPRVWGLLLPRRDTADLQARSAVNASIVRWCAARSGCAVADAWPLLADAEGRAQPMLYEPDGIHLAPAGYAAWIATLRAALATVRPDAATGAPPR